MWVLLVHAARDIALTSTTRGCGGPSELRVLILGMRSHACVLLCALGGLGCALGGEQVLTYDNGEPRAMSLGPADELILGFEDTLSAYDTNAALLWEGSFACPEAVGLDHVELDGARRTWVSGRHGDAAFVAMIEPAP